MKKIKNIKDLREDLLLKYEEAKTEEDMSALETNTRTVSAIIRSLTVELDYNKTREKDVKIEFLEVEE